MQYDWVFGTDYQGELAAAPSSLSSLDAAADTRLGEAEGGNDDDDDYSSAAASVSEGRRWEPAGPGVIDRELLQATEQPILFYADVPLYEDELHDNGAVQLAAKIRVMPTCVHTDGWINVWRDGWMGRRCPRGRAVCVCQCLLG